MLNTCCFCFFMWQCSPHNRKYSILEGTFLNLSYISKHHTFAAKSLRCLHHQWAICHRGTSHQGGDDCTQFANHLSSLGPMRIHLSFAQAERFFVLFHSFTRTTKSCIFLLLLRRFASLWWRRFRSSSLQALGDSKPPASVIPPVHLAMIQIKNHYKPHWNSCVRRHA